MVAMAALASYLYYYWFQGAVNTKCLHAQVLNIGMDILSEKN